jgi:hypothetical protein
MAMKYYSEWQDALLDFIKLYGHNYPDSYNLTAEFEIQLQQNVRGAYFLHLEEDE